MWNVVLDHHHCASIHPGFLQTSWQLITLSWNYSILIKFKMATQRHTEFISSLFSIKFEIAEVFTQWSYKSKMTVESDKALAAGRALSPADLPTPTSVSWQLSGESGWAFSIQIFCQNTVDPSTRALRNSKRREARNLVLFKPSGMLDSCPHEFGRRFDENSRRFKKNKVARFSAFRVTQSTSGRVHRVLTKNLNAERPPTLPAQLPTDTCRGWQVSGAESAPCRQRFIALNCHFRFVRSLSKNLSYLEFYWE
jgi:hypothetical protein